LPIEAVAGTRSNGLVYLQGEDKPRPVELGITDGAYIEISDGATVGDVVSIPSPSLLPANG